MPASTAPWGRGTGIGEGAPRALPPIGTPAADAPGWPGGPGGGGEGGEAGGGGGGGGGGGSSGTAEGSGHPGDFGGVANPKSGQAMDPASLRDMISARLDIPKEQAAAIVSNLAAESGLKADINEGKPLIAGSRGGYGLAQWTADRRRDLEGWAQSKGLDVRLHSTQVEFMAHELDAKFPGWRKKLAAAGNDPQEIAKTFFRLYESGGAASLEQHLGKHIAHARQFANLPSGETKTAAASPPPTPPSLPPRAPLAPSPAAISTLTSPPPVAAQASAGGGSWAGGSQTLPPVGASTTAQEFQMASNTSNVDRSQSSQTHIGDLHVHTAATDAAGIAKSIKGELKRYDYVSQVDTGLV
jgi:hypothetical protein